MRGTIGALIAWGLLAGCGASPVENPEAEVQEAALRWAFSYANTDLDPPAAYYLALSPYPLEDGDDPDAAFLARFSEQPIPARPVSQCDFRGSGRHHVVDRATGRHGLLFTVSPVVWEEPSRARVGVGFLQGPTWGAGWECMAEQASPDGGWRIAECTLIFHV